MDIEAVDVRGYRVLRIKQDLCGEGDLDDLKAVVRSHLDQGVKDLAVSFTRDTVFYSRCLAVLVQFLGFVKERDGNFAIVHPNAGMLRMLELIGLSRMIQTCESEDGIGAGQGAEGG